MGGYIAAVGSSQGGPAFVFGDNKLYFYFNVPHQQNEQKTFACHHVMESCADIHKDKP